MLSRQLADKLGVRAGDRVWVEELGGRRSRQALPVARVIEEFVGERDTPTGNGRARLGPGKLRP